MTSDIAAPRTGKHRVAAVVVTFHPEQSILAELVQAVASQTDGIVIIDNGGHVSSILKILPSETRAVLIHNNSNLGVAAAQNQGILWADRQGFTHVFILDQDSVPAPGCVPRLLEAEETLRGKCVPLAAVGPRVVDRRTGRTYSFKKYRLIGSAHRMCTSSEDLIHTDFVIASGSLIAMEALRSVGTMDEDLFIDRIDIDWCLRAAAGGRSIYGVCGAELRHEPGSQTRRVWFGRWIDITLHSPERSYYMFRNSLLLYRRRYVPFRWIVNDIGWLIGVLVVSCALSPDAMRRVKLACKGVRDGLIMVRGSLVEQAGRHPR